jgi:hypothetical protein
MKTVRCQIVRRRYARIPPSSELLTLNELARLARVHPDIVECLLEWGLVEPMESEPELLFKDSAVPTIRRIMRIRNDLGLNWAGIGVVLDLLGRIDNLERENTWLRAQVVKQ